MINIQNDKVYIIISGKVYVKVDDIILETLSSGDHFGGVHSVLNYPSFFTFEADDQTLIYSVSAEILQNIPIVRWKILERYERQKHKLFKYHMQNDDNIKFSWTDNYRINICEMDNHHKRLFEIIDNLNICLRSKTCDSAPTILESLIEYVKYHFKVEEKFMNKYKFSNTDNHITAHRNFEQKLDGFREDINNNTLNKNKIILTVKSWLVNHILEEDKKYGKFLNEKGVF